MKNTEQIPENIEKYWKYGKILKTILKIYENIENIEKWNNTEKYGKILNNIINKTKNMENYWKIPKILMASWSHFGPSGASETSSQHQFHPG